MASSKAKSLINWKNGAGENMVGFINTGFATPDQIMQAGKELIHLAEQAKLADRYVRIWCDRGEKNNGKPYCQMLIDKWNKVDRFKWLKEKAAQLRAKRESKA
jgi:hypothetical protein